MSTILTTQATAVGGRNGHVTSSDGVVDFELSMPGTKGKEGVKTSNPEQLFAAGYASCFDGALNLIASRDEKKIKSKTTAEISLLNDETDNGFKIGGKITVEISGISHEEAQVLVEKAHDFCPYSKATKGNIDVEVKAKAV
jgi:osmotically inducible protein OsmC